MLDYNPATGAFTWRTRPLDDFSDLRACNAWNARYAGKNAGGRSAKKYIAIAIDGVHYFAHRLAWLHVTGSWPDNTVDHRDGVGAHNWFSNLRDVTKPVNNENIRAAPVSKQSGLPLGVYRHARLKKTPFSASIGIDGATVFLGYYETANEAHAAYLAAKRQHHQGCTI